VAAHVILADDHNLIREGIRGLLQARMPEVQVVGEASDGLEALRLCEQHQPDLVLLDISMPQLGGLEVLARLPSVSPRTRAVILSQYDDRAYVVRALRLGARGYLLKKAMGADLVNAMRAVLEGKTFLDPAVAQVVVDAVVAPEESGAGAEELSHLTAREIEVLKLTAEGRTAKEVGQVLGISEHTVNRHRANLMEKFDLHGKVDLVKLAARLKLIQLS
jgi:DNA-binding NarL/FixJ family response regulator